MLLMQISFLLRGVFSTAYQVDADSAASDIRNERKIKHEILSYLLIKKIHKTQFYEIYLYFKVITFPINHISISGSKEEGNSGNTINYLSLIIRKRAIAGILVRVTSYSNYLKVIPSRPWHNLSLQYRCPGFVSALFSF